MISDFPNSPFRTGIADGVFFVFALDNICNTKQALREAARLTTTHGVIAGIDPGLSIWTTKILLHSIASRQPNSGISEYLKGRKFSAEVEDYFVEKPYSEHEYTDFTLAQTIGQTAEQLSSAVEKAASEDCKHWKSYYRFHEYITRLYYQHIVESSKDAGFRLTKTGIIAIAQTANGWEVSKIVEINKESWLDELMQAKRWQRANNPLIGNFPVTMDKAERRMVLPAFCMVKV